MKEDDDDDDDGVRTSREGLFSTFPMRWLIRGGDHHGDFRRQTIAPELGVTQYIT